MFGAVYTCAVPDYRRPMTRHACKVPLALALGLAIAVGQPGRAQQPPMQWGAVEGATMPELRDIPAPAVARLATPSPECGAAIETSVVDRIRSTRRS